MSRRHRTLAIPALTLCLALRSLGAQGITSAAIEGVVARVDGPPLGGATVRVTDPASGARWQVATDDAGRYFLENVQVGGPYVVDAMAVGFRPARRASVILTLGQRHRADFVLEPTVVTLGAVTVRAAADRPLRSTRTGPEYVAAEATIGALPNVARDISVALALAPLAVLRPFGGVSIGGQNQGYNSLQVDGGVNADLYLGRTPGGASPSAALPEVLPHSISIETVREVQVLAAPFDVRLGGFAGGLLNAVTRSGTNEFHGSMFGFLQDGRLAARGPAGRRAAFTTRQFGGTLSGPIVRDRIHFFVNADVQRRVVPDAGPLVTDTAARATRVPYDSALRFQSILLAQGLGPGSLGPDDAHLPAQDFFAKITMQLGLGGHLELSQRYAHADRRGFPDVSGRVDTVPLSSVAGRSRSTARTSRAIWTTLIGGRAQNEAIVSYERLSDSCQPNGSLPRIQVMTNSGYLIAGPNPVCPTTAVEQSALELTENLTVGAGRHLVTVGSHAELLHFRDPLVQGSAGRWFFSSLAALEARTATHYDRGIPSATRPSGARFRAVTIGVYAQDRWAPTSRLTLTPGLRLDVPFLPDAVSTNAALQQALGIDTAQLPSGNVLWSPRVGINYAFGGRGTTILRGGIGLFGGPPPFRWLGNAYRESGDESVVSCDGNNTPRFDPGAQPPTCTTGGVAPRISFFDPGFKLPQNLKLAIGVDRDVGAGVSATLDLLYTRALHQVYITDANLGAPSGAALAEGGRLLYGIIDTTGRSSPRWRDTSFGEIYRLSNGSGDESVSLSAQLRKNFGELLSMQASYAWSRARDRMSLVNFPSRANFSNTPLDGSLDDRRLRSSFFETPHKLSLGATLTAPYGLQLALLYLGASQPPYTYVVGGDVNADGIGGPGSLFNDILYVPRNATPGDDIDLVVPRSGSPGAFDPAPASAYQRLDAFIDRQPCLREQRGRIMKRGSCRNGWLDLLNARVSKTFSAARGDHVEIIADIFNLPNLVNSQWGRHRDVTADPSVPLLRLRKYDTTRGRGRYELGTLSRGIVDNSASRWHVQLGLRYGF